MQLAHAGRKASTYRPWSGTGAISEAEGGWQNVLAPTAVAFADNYPQPREMSKQEIAATAEAFAAAAKRALAAGFRVLEIHAAHGYLLHEFLSPLSNRRTDEYGGSFENRTRIVRDVANAIRTPSGPGSIRCSPGSPRPTGPPADGTSAIRRSRAIS
jgi:2,4-dienoyl-CoA reductase-like NADH-dependent reductase (Old Yellow Enzyme family)